MSKFTKVKRAGGEKIGATPGGSGPEPGRSASRLSLIHI